MIFKVAALPDHYKVFPIEGENNTWTKHLQNPFMKFSTLRYLFPFIILKIIISSFVFYCKNDCSTYLPGPDSTANARFLLALRQRQLQYLRHEQQNDIRTALALNQSIALHFLWKKRRIILLFE